MVVRASLPVPRIPIPSSIRLGPADVGAGLRVPVPAHALFVIVAAIGVEPDDGIARTVALSGAFGFEELKRSAGDWRLRDVMMIG